MMDPSVSRNAVPPLALAIQKMIEMMLQTAQKT